MAVGAVVSAQVSNCLKLCASQESIVFRSSLSNPADDLDLDF
jgi:hypothetical protein